MKDIFLFRHGETDWNLSDRIQGQTDIPLNAEGRLQAQELGKKLVPLKLEIILSSPLIRASETAQIANRQLNIPIIFSDHLKEASLGEVEGMTLTELYQLYSKDYFLKWRSGLKIYDDINFAGAESKTSIGKRAVDYITEFASDSEFQRIGISTHGFLIRRILASIDERLPLDGKMPNISIWHLMLDDNNQLYLK